MAVVVREDRPQTPLGLSLDGSNRYVGSEVREFTVRGLANAKDRALSISEILLAPVDGATADSVAGSTLGIGQAHFYFDGSTADRPIARVRSHTYRAVNSTEAVFLVAYNTYYRGTYGSIPITDGTEPELSETEHTTEVYYADPVVNWRQGFVRRKRIVRHRYDRYVVAPSDVDAFAEYAASGKTYEIAETNGVVRWLYLGHSLRDNPTSRGQKILTRQFYRIEPLQALIPTPDQPGLAAVPPIPAFGMIETIRLEASGPVYASYDHEDLYPDGGPSSNLPPISAVIDPFDD